MTRRKRWLLAGLGGLAIGFGLGCMNYTNPATLEHHRTWASEHSVPAPGRTVQLAGGAGLVLGGSLITLAVTGRRRPSRLS